MRLVILGVVTSTWLFVALEFLHWDLYIWVRRLAEFLFNHPQSFQWKNVQCFSEAAVVELKGHFCLLGWGPSQ